MVTCLELAIFSLGKSVANLYAGGIVFPGACVGIFLGNYLFKRLQLSPKGAIQVVLFFNLLCMGLYTALYFLGCENSLKATTGKRCKHKFGNYSLSSSG
ncbi:Solute carrier organic anion transporter member 5A1 [Tyrophagus putrescentiae]|nr:Solute carrier organic anion transporter member 5A1 [Tyrophagus putrescentiae]